MCFVYVYRFLTIHLIIDIKTKRQILIWNGVSTIFEIIFEYQA
jgi:hypothetical protein